MPRRKRIEVANTIYNRGLIVRVKWTGYEKTKEMITALADGGAFVVEQVIPPDGDKDFAALTRHFGANDPLVVLGGGPANNSETADRLIAAGADFITGVLDVETARLCNRNRIFYVPMVSDAVGVNTANETGVELVRVDLKGPEELAALLTECPASNLLPAKGVGAEEIAAWFRAGAACLSFEAEQAEEEYPAGAADLIWEAARGRGLPLFAGLEHWGTYPERGRDSREIVDWYLDLFSFKHLEGEGFHFVHSAGPGRLEILKDYEPTRGHVAIKVRHLGASVEALAAKGIEFEPVKDFGRNKAVFFKQRDPAGNKVHLLYQAVA